MSYTQTDAAQAARLESSPAFAELARRRGRLSWTLALVIIAIYGAFLLIVAFDKPLAGAKIGGGPLTLAFPLGLGVIVAAIALTGFYVWRANAVFDPLIARIRADAGGTP